MLAVSEQLELDEETDVAAISIETITSRQAEQLEPTNTVSAANLCDFVAMLGNRWIRTGIVACPSHDCQKT